MNVKVIADSTCDLPNEIINKFDIDIVPLYVILDEQSFKDKVEITTRELVDWSNKTNQTPKTSAPSVDDFMNAFKPYVEKKQDIVFVCISSELSATCQNANLVAGMIDDITIKVVDSRNVALGTGIVAYKAAKYAQQGLSADKIEEKLLELAPKVFTGFVLDKLDFLRRGGRCSALQAFAATSLKLRPEIVSRDGRLVPGGKFRGSMDKVVKGYFGKKLSDLNEIEDEMVFVVTTVDEMGLSPLSAEIVKGLGYFKEVVVTDAGCVITAHSGPNTYGLFFIRK